jgi:hypothetical protein
LKHVDEEFHEKWMHCNDCPGVRPAYDQRKGCRERDEKQSNVSVALLRFEKEGGKCRSGLGMF